MNIVLSLYGRNLQVLSSFTWIVSPSDYVVPSHCHSELGEG